MNELRSLIKERTTLLITHNTSDLDLADEIYVLDNGKIVSRKLYQYL
ncbi:MAG TPA: hypothetical protein VEI53_00355 [Ktedonobacteraceae bacterium]|nr:hypothetical protein [Ktedonobacteraceae bacterium]